MEVHLEDVGWQRVTRPPILYQNFARGCSEVVPGTCKHPCLRRLDRNEWRMLERFPNRRR